MYRLTASLPSHPTVLAPLRHGTASHSPRTCTVYLGMLSLQNCSLPEGLQCEAALHLPRHSLRAVSSRILVSQSDQGKNPPPKIPTFVNKRDRCIQLTSANETKQSEHTLFLERTRYPPSSDQNLTCENLWLFGQCCSRSLIRFWEWMKGMV